MDKVQSLRQELVETVAGADEELLENTLKAKNLLWKKFKRDYT